MVGAYAVYKYRGVHYVPAKYGALPTTAAAHVSAYKNQSSKKKREKKKKEDDRQKQRRSPRSNKTKTTTTGKKERLERASEREREINSNKKQ